MNLDTLLPNKVNGANSGTLHCRVMIRASMERSRRDESASVQIVALRGDSSTWRRPCVGRVSSGLPALWQPSRVWSVPLGKLRGSASRHPRSLLRGGACVKSRRRCIGSPGSANTDPGTQLFHTVTCQRCHVNCVHNVNVWLSSGPVGPKLKKIKQSYLFVYFFFFYIFINNVVHRICTVVPLCSTFPLFQSLCKQC